MDENNLFRDAFSAKVVDYIADRVKGAYPEFDRAGFVARVMDGFAALSFGDRAGRITEGLRAYLPPEFPEAVGILVRSLGPEPESDELSGFDGFYVMPLCGYVGRYGLGYPELSLQGLYEMTKRFTAEGDVRPFLRRYPERTLEFLDRLTRDPSPFARRLASEGTRPRLPLAGRFPEFQRDPAPVIALLDKLYTDPSLMVRRSVANNINDISKDNPEIAVATLERWAKRSPGPQTDWLVRHGLRTLIKQGYPGALELLGFGSPGDVAVEGFRLSGRSLRLGRSLEFSWTLRSTSRKPQKLALNYLIYFRKADGGNRPKVFRLPDKTLAAGESLELAKVHKFRPFKNQRFYPGTHYLELSVNGGRHGRTPFELSI